MEISEIFITTLLLFTPFYKSSISLFVLILITFLSFSFFLSLCVSFSLSLCLSWTQTEKNLNISILILRFFSSFLFAVFQPTNDSVITDRFQKSRWVWLYRFIKFLSSTRPTIYRGRGRYLRQSIFCWVSRQLTSVNCSRTVLNNSWFALHKIIVNKTTTCAKYKRLLK
jgi:hypothetical protein